MVELCFMDFIKPDFLEFKQEGTTLALLCDPGYTPVSSLLWNSSPTSYRQTPGGLSGWTALQVRVAD